MRKSSFDIETPQLILLSKVLVVICLTNGTVFVKRTGSLTVPKDVGIRPWGRGPLPARGKVVAPYSVPERGWDEQEGDGSWDAPTSPLTAHLR